MLFTSEEIEQLKIEAKAEAAQLFKKQLIAQALKEQLVEPVATINLGEPLDSDWVVEPVKPEPELSAEDDFAETKVYGIALRVNRTGTKVQVHTNGRWEDRTISHTDDSVPFVTIPNKLCPSSRAKNGQMPYRLTHLVLQAFKEMPEYMTNVLFTRKGPTIMFGLRLVEQINGDKNNCHIDNLKWVEQNKFEKAVEKKKARFNIEP